MRTLKKAFAFLFASVLSVGWSFPELDPLFYHVCSHISYLRFDIQGDLSAASASKAQPVEFPARGRRERTLSRCLQREAGQDPSGSRFLRDT